MISVIIAGGSGSRLWPLSTPKYPKHLLKIGGDSLSLLQNTYKRVSKISSAVYIVSEAGHSDHVKAQLNELPDGAFIVEPARRGTANCMIAALAHIAEQAPTDEAIAFVHADHYIRDVAGFRHSFKAAQRLAVDKGQIVLVGVEPSYPSIGFGYIEKGELLSEGSYAFSVKSFTEKPDYETALSYLQSGNYLWNGGYFVATVATFKRCLHESAPELAANYEAYVAASAAERQALYLGFKPQAIDYALIEKVSDLLVIQASFDWMDLGSFRDFNKAVGSDKIGNYVRGAVALDEVENSLILNDDKKPMVVIGLDNVVIINTAEGLLVTRKDLSQKVGDISKRITTEHTT